MIYSGAVFVETVFRLFYHFDGFATYNLNEDATFRIVYLLALEVEVNGFAVISSKKFLYAVVCATVINLKIFETYLSCIGK